MGRSVEKKRLNGRLRYDELRLLRANSSARYERSADNREVLGSNPSWPTRVSTRPLAGGTRWPNSRRRFIGSSSGTVVFRYGSRNPESPRHSRLPGLAVVRERCSLVMTKDALRLSNHAPRSRCSLWCPRAALPRERAEGPPSLAVVGARRRLPEGAAGSLSAYVVRVRRACLALSVHQDPASQSAERPTGTVLI